jgi:signal transduction histidine kinase
MSKKSIHLAEENVLMGINPHVPSEIDLCEQVRQINQIILHAGSTEDLSGWTHRVLEQIHGAIPFTTAELLVYQGSRQEASVLASLRDPWLDPLPARQFSLAGQTIDRCEGLQDGEIDLQDHRRLPRTYLQSLNSQGIANLVNAPLIENQALVGTLVLGFMAEYALSPQQTWLLATAADTLAIALRQSDNCKEVMERANELETVVTISSSLRKARQRSEMFRILTTTVTSALDADVGSIFILEEGGLTVTASVGDDEIWVGRHFDLDYGLLKQVMGDGSPSYRIIAPEDRSTSSPVLWQQVTRSVRSSAIIPLTTTDQTIGFLFLGRHRPEPFSDLQKRELSAVADLGGNAFYRERVLETLEQRVADRTRALTTLYNIASIGNTAPSIQAILDFALQETLSTFKCSHGMIHLLDDEQKTLRLVSKHGWTGQALPADGDWFAENPFWRWIPDQSEPLWVLDLEHDPRTAQYDLIRNCSAYLGAPILSRGRVVGAISLMGEVVYNFTRDDFTLASTIADQVGILLESFQFRKAAEEKAVNQERQRLARDLHDSVTQSLYSLVFLSENWRRAIQNGRLKDAQLWPEQLEKIAHQALKEMRLLLYELRPVDLEQLRLAEAIQQRLVSVEERSKIHTTLVVNGQDRLSRDLTHELYLIAYEALSNILKHAECTRVHVKITFEASGVALEVSDNGCGFDVSAIDRLGGMGLRGINERTQKIGGTLKITSNPGVGTTLAVRVGI